MDEKLRVMEKGEPMKVQPLHLTGPWGLSSVTGETFLAVNPPKARIYEQG